MNTHSSSSNSRGSRSTCPSSLSIPPYNNTNTSSGSAACCTTTASSTKKALYLLGTIILIMACIGPSGLLWDVFDMDTSNDLYSHSHHGSNHVSVHGDKHHNLPPPPPSYNVGSNNNNNQISYHGMNIEHPMMVRREEGYATNSRHDKFGIKTEKRLEKTTAINRRKQNVSY